MSGATEKGSSVVDSIRIPPWLRERAERWWRELPVIARLFLGLALLDVVGRSIGFLAPAIGWAYLTPLAFVSAYLPHDLWILLPALVVSRRPDAARATPWVLGGAVVVAVVELARSPLEALLGGMAGPSTLPFLVGAAGGLGLLAAWVLLARGLRAITAGEPSETVAGLATLAAAALGLLAAVWFADLLVAPAIDLGDPALNQAMALGNLTSPLQLLGWAYLMWVVIRGIGDVRRPAIATTLAGAGALMAAFIVPIATVLARLLGAIGVDLGSGSGLGEVYQIVRWFGDIVGPTLVAAAFGLGLAEPPTPYLAPAPPSSPVPAPPAVDTLEPAESDEPPAEAPSTT